MDEFVTTRSSTRINKIAKAIGAKTYLEVGVCKGTTFMNIDIPYKMGVDPLFQFEYAKQQKKGKIEFFEGTSDEFFMSGHSKEYDIIFLDGLHTFEQTFRDFSSSIGLSHSRTVWVIDDVIPSDIFSANPDLKTAISFRKDYGVSNLTWHGDTYKVVFAINDFFLQHSFVTLDIHPNPQTIVWYEPRKDFSPVFSDLEKISRLDYYDFVKNKASMNLSSDEDGLIANLRKK